MVVLTPESYRELAAKLGVSGGMQQQQPAKTLRQTQQGPAPPGGQVGAAVGNSFAIFDREDETGEATMEDEDLQASMHPTGGKRQSRKGRRRELKETSKKR